MALKTPIEGSRENVCTPKPCCSAIIRTVSADTSGKSGRCIGEVQDNAPLPVACLAQGLRLAGLSQGEDLADGSDNGAGFNEIRDATEQVGRGLPVHGARADPMVRG